MHLKSLEIAGFKSFAKKTFLEFNTNISSVVGPNGSGKSNVVEAFRFALGEQSIKTMRGKRGEDLIFNGSQSIPRGNRASVKIVFDNRGRFLDIDYDEVIIERQVHRDGVNQYFINKSPVRLKDVSELLAGANIGSSGHHIISQGEADKILNVNPKERKLIIEEALGLKIYQYKRIASEKKLDKVRENIDSVQSLRKENVPHLKFLKKQIIKIEKTLEMRNELKILYQEYFKREDIYLKYWKEKIEKDKSPLLIKLTQLEKDLKEAKSILENSEKDNDKSGSLVELEKQLTNFRSQKDELTLKLGRVEGTISVLEVKPSLKNNDNEIRIDFEKVKNLELEINDQIKLADNLEDIAQIKGVLKRIKESFSQFIKKYSNTELVEEGDVKTDDKLNELNLEKEKIEKEVMDIKKQETGILSKFNILKSEIEKEKDSNRGAELAVFEISAKQSEIKSELNSLQNLEEKIILADENYKKEMTESYVLVGRDAIQIKDLKLEDENRNILSISDIVNEMRETQTERLKKIERIKILIEDSGGGSGEDIVQEYEEVQKRDEFLINEIEDLEKSAESLVALIEELKEKLEVEFKDGLEKIDKQFQEFFTLMFGGGKANLSLVKEKIVRRKKDTDLNLDEEDLIAEVEEEEEINDEKGIEVNVSLPNKKTKGLQMLSGGERSLTSIALLFAMSQVNPPPFIVLDETDAALDEANSKKYGDMIEKLSELSQLILITHNRETMSRANILYGVTMGADGVSKLLSIQFGEAVQVAK
ncbi:MAG: AAA family ATPase [Candidatus Pacebacteria bacterium]|nr:AAA family ATPase [Candidatus Paceibacterota bacterium]